MADDLGALLCAAQEWGWVGLVASERGLRLLTLPRPTPEAAADAIREQYPEVSAAPAGEEHASPIDELLAQASQQVCEYLAGTRREFTTPLDLRGHTGFALSVWATTRRIGYGQTRCLSMGGRACGRRERNLPGRRRGVGRQPSAVDHSLPSRRGHGWQLARLCRRLRDEAASAGPGGRARPTDRAVVCQARGSFGFYAKFMLQWAEFKRDATGRLQRGYWHGHKHPGVPRLSDR